MDETLFYLLPPYFVNMIPMLTGTNLKFANAYNVRIVLETIRLYGPLSRAEIARSTELTAQTVSNITRKLIDQGLVREGRRRQEGRGAPSVELTLQADSAFSIGLDLDKDHLTAVLLDLVGKVRRRVQIELDFPTPEEAMDVLVATAEDLITSEGVNRSSVIGVGVGLPGPLDISEASVVTNVANPKAFPGWKNVPVADLLKQRLNLPIFLENNATAAAVGERRYGAGRHISTFFYVFFGAGLGGGLIVDGHPYEGHTGNAGELGYIATGAGGAGDDLSRAPHLGTYFHLPQLYDALRASGREAGRPADLEALYLERNECLLDWLETGVRQLAPVLLGIEYILDPEAIFFGGRLPACMLEAVTARLEKMLPSMRIEEKRTAPRLLLATAGADVAALGVATLPMHAALSPAPRVLMKDRTERRSMRSVLTRQ